MGWMHDTLLYFSHEPVHRKYHQNDLTFAMLYHHHENFILPLSHDEVVHGKGSLLDKMPGHDQTRFANLRLLLAWQHAQPGKKLLFMGGEFGQGREWSHEVSLDWHLLNVDRHQGIQRWVRDLNRIHRQERALHVRDCAPDGFEWVDCGDAENGVVSLLRRGGEGDRPVLAVFNFTPILRAGYRVGVPSGGVWRELLNGDAGVYGGTGAGNLGGVRADPAPLHARPFSVSLTLPPLAALFLVPEEEAGKG
jgi:1,4-alpha-glucan branching enzyme